MTPDVSFVIVAYNSRRHLATLLPTLPAKAEVLVVDNGSTDGVAAWLAAEHPRVRVIAATNRGFGAGCNRGAREARGRIVVFANPDTAWTERGLDGLCASVQPRQVATAQLALMQEPTKVDTRGLDLHFCGLGVVRGHNDPIDDSDALEPVPGVSGAAFAMLRQEFLDLGGFDERIFLYGEDVELSWRLNQQGFRIVCPHRAIVLHDHVMLLHTRKVGQLEAARQYIVRRYWTTGQRILYFPSLAMTRLLGWGAGARRVERIPGPRAPRGFAWRAWTRSTLPQMKFLPKRARIPITFANMLWRLNTWRMV